MSIKAGIHKLGPHNTTLQVKTSRHGAAAMAGHNLVIDVTSWEATLDVGEDPGQISLELNATLAPFGYTKAPGEPNRWATRTGSISSRRSMNTC